LSKVVINCAGNNADKIAALSGIDIEKEGEDTIITFTDTLSLINKQPLQFTIASK